MTRLAQHGIAVDLPRGWEGSIHLRDPLDGASTHPVLHAGTFPLPRQRGDFGSGAVDRMTADDVLVVLLEYQRYSVDAPLFASRRQPRSLAASMFDTSTLQRMIPGHCGTQVFFVESGRAFCLYVVLGANRNRERLVRTVNTLLPRIQITPAGP